jgi:tetratricopeptide (TPR) repeat protein
MRKADQMDKHDLLERYEVRSEERDFLAAKPLYEQALAQNEDAQLLLEYGYLLECHARNELRHAAKQYRRAVELDPALDKARYQLIQALAALFDTDEMIALYKRRVAAAPGQAREYRFLASALLAAGRAEQARTVIDTGLALDPADRTLIAQRGEAKATVGDPHGALADWRHALQLDDSDIGPLYSSAYLLEREGRIEEAIEAWRSILSWNEQGGQAPEAEFPARELERLRQQIENNAE